MIRVNKEVEEALKNGKPVVALESTIISHGMPYPRNVKTALMVEEEIRNNGCIPATIGIIDGVAVVGMSPEEIEEFGKRPNIKKASRRDLPIVFGNKEWAATTVATTMIIAAEAGIEVFVTGGIGGVHRGAPESFDISADLIELSQTNVTVICAGAKAILDLPLTMEYLETMGVPVLGFQTNELPAFYTPHSGIELDYAIKDYKNAADIIKAKRSDERLNGGILICVPIPEEYAMDKDAVNNAIEAALLEAKKNNIKGKRVTPFLLKTVTDLTGGSSLESNIHLILNNAKVGANIALELAKNK